MKSRDIISSVFWMTIGSGICYAGYNMELGSLRAPGPGFIFFWMGIVMVGLSLGIFIRAIREAAAPGELKRVLWTEIRWKKIISVLAAVSLYAYFFTSVGFILSTIPLLIFLFKISEPQSWVKAILGSVITTLMAYGVFHLWLGSPLPSGLLG